MQELSEYAVADPSTILLGNRERGVDMDELMKARDILLMSARNMFRDDTPELFWEFREVAMKAVTAFFLYCHDKELGND